MLNWIDRIPYAPLVIFAFFILMAPFRPMPHVWEKLSMLMHGNLLRPIDIIDMIYHLLPTVVLAIKIYRDKTGRSFKDGGDLK